LQIYVRVDKSVFLKFDLSFYIKTDSLP